MLRTSVRLWAVVLLGLISAAAVSGCQSDTLTTVVLSGRGVYPPEVASGALGEQEPVANAVFQVLDLTLPADNNIVSVGVTDIDGVYFTRINATPAVAVVMLGVVRVSGLIDSTVTAVTKDFNGVTDIACEAGVTAIYEGAILSFDLDQQRIANLEAGAAVALQQIDVDFTDEDGSRTAAVLLTRQLTDDGAHPPQQS